MNTKIVITGVLLCCLIGVFSCGNGNKSEVNQQQPDTISTLVQDTVKIAVHQPEFPKDVEILLPTQYRKESTGYPKGVKEKEWYEIYKVYKTGEWKIAKADLEVTYGRDECVGEDVMIVKSKHEDAGMFFTPFEGLSENPITILEDKLLFPERNISFNFKGKEYKILPMGTCLNESGQMMTASEVKAKKEEDLINNTKISGYRLFFEEEGINALEIAAIESMEYSTPRVIWAGDLNNDGMPDLILDLSDFYESRHLFFFLSDKNDKEKPLKKVADLKVVNDC